MDDAIRMAPRAVGGEPRLSFVAQDSFRQDRSRPIPGAEKKHVVTSSHRDHSCAAQQDDPQQGCSAPLFATAGFFARMNALTNLPSTCGAIASTSIPCAVRNCRASATL